MEIDVKDPEASKILNCIGNEEGASSKNGGFEMVIQQKIEDIVKALGYISEGSGNLYKDIIGRVEKALILMALEMTGYSKARAARLLGIHRNTLAKKMCELGLAKKPRE